MFKGALFDLDGVIADTASLHFDAWRQIILKHFEVSIPDTIEEKTKGVSREDSLRVILEHLNISISDYDFMNLCEEKNKLYVKSLEDSFFDAIANPEDITNGKPAPDIFLAAAKSIHCGAEECIAIEDSVAGVTAINSANIFSVAVGGTELSHANKLFSSTKELTLLKVEKAWQNCKR